MIFTIRCIISQLGFTVCRFALVIACLSFPVFTQESLQDSEKIQYGDLIDVDVIGSFEYDWRGQIDAEGNLGGFDTVEEKVFARCKTEAEVADQISELYSKFLREPKVRVKIIDRTNRPLVYLDGAVKFPQRFQLKRRVKLDEILIKAGGLTDKADGTINIYRPKSLRCESPSSEAPDTFSVKIVELLAGKPESNPEIINGDIINVISNSPVYVLGGVKYPGQRPFREGMMLSRLIEASGGLTKNAQSDKIIVFRKKSNEPTVIKVDLSAITANPEADIELKPFDVIDIVERGGDLRETPPIIRNDSVTSFKFELAPLRIID